MLLQLPKEFISINIFRQLETRHFQMPGDASSAFSIGFLTMNLRRALFGHMTVGGVFRLFRDLRRISYFLKRLSSFLEQLNFLSRCKYADKDTGRQSVVLVRLYLV